MSSILLHGPSVRLFMGLVCVLSLWNTASGLKGEAKKEKGMTFLREAVTGSKGLKKEKDGALLGATVSVHRAEERKKKRVELLASTELPAWSVDLSALNLTELVNGMLRRALKAEGKKFFSLLSITSYSSFAFHKVSVAIYNISNPKTVDPATFPTRYCYCLNNRTSDLSDFAALLVDIVGNSTSYLTEIFKSTSILSVSQTNESDCVFLCVMAGKSGRNFSDFRDIVEKSPVVNYTFTSGLSKALATSETARTSRPTSQRQPTLPTSSPIHWTVRTQGASAWSIPPWTEISPPSEVSGNVGMLPEPPAGPTATQGHASHIPPASEAVTPGTQTPSPTKAPAPRDPQTGIGPVEWSFTPEQQPALVPAPHRPSRCPQPLLKEGFVAATPLSLAIPKLSPCLMELCRFFQQCLCVGQRRDASSEAVRYCLEHYSWFLKNATLICQKVQKVSHSRTLKQKCRENVCMFV
uniref:HERV-H LTR-associating protein 1 n=1 Tax=Jaculus jaculus TaxID=51337 RepID=UPI001E1B2D06|nr:HERV-H LTR-associating protein 1 [Jaculus jaculus]